LSFFTRIGTGHKPTSVRSVRSLPLVSVANPGGNRSTQPAQYRYWNRHGIPIRAKTQFYVSVTQ
jgi:hypothetical protein